MSLTKNFRAASDLSRLSQACRQPAVMGSHCGGWVRGRMRAMQESVCQPGGEGGSKGRRRNCRLWVSLRGSLLLTGLLGLLQCVFFFCQKRKLNSDFLPWTAAVRRLTPPRPALTIIPSTPLLFLRIPPTHCFVTIVRPHWNCGFLSFISESS